MVAESVREGRFDDLTDTLIARMDRHGVEKAVIMRGAFPARNADLAAIVARHPDRFAAFAAWDLRRRSATRRARARKAWRRWSAD